MTDAFYCPYGYGECETANGCCYPGRCYGERVAVVACDFRKPSGALLVDKTGEDLPHIVGDTTMALP